jgi:hypothetical protein
VILNKGGDQIGLVPVPTGIKTGRELAQLFKEHNVEFPVASAYVKVATEDEERIQRILSVWGRSLELTKGTPGPVPGPQVLKGEVTPAYFRTLAKIGFHYVLTHIPTIVGNEPKFHPLREFIRFGTGDPRRFVHRLNKAPNTNGPPGHVLAAIAVPDNITVNMQFFVGCKVTLPQWSLVIPNPTVLIVRQTIAHYYTYVTEPDGSLRGGEVVELNIQ